MSRSQMPSRERFSFQNEWLLHLLIHCSGHVAEDQLQADAAGHHQQLLQLQCLLTQRQVSALSLAPQLLTVQANQMLHGQAVRPICVPEDARNGHGEFYAISQSLQHLQSFPDHRVTTLMACDLNCAGQGAEALQVCQPRRLVNAWIIAGSHWLRIACKHSSWLSILLSACSIHACSLVPSAS